MQSRTNAECERLLCVDGGARVPPFHGAPARDKSREAVEVPSVGVILAIADDIADPSVADRIIKAAVETFGRVGHAGEQRRHVYREAL
jgi:hypothetical protein